MKETKDEPKKVSTCFEGLPCAEMMERIMGEDGIGSLCEKMMRSLTKKNPGRGEEGPEPRTAPAEKKDQRKGDET